MKILKNGDLRKFNQVKEFSCHYCGCVFEANKNEYTLHDDQRDGPWIEIRCPCCKTRLTPYLY